MNVKGPEWTYVYNSGLSHFVTYNRAACGFVTNGWTNKTIDDMPHCEMCQAVIRAAVEKSENDIRRGVR